MSERRFPSEGEDQQEFQIEVHGDREVPEVVITPEGEASRSRQAQVRADDVRTQLAQEQRLQQTAPLVQRELSPAPPKHMFAKSLALGVGLGIMGAAIAVGAGLAVSAGAVLTISAFILGAALVPILAGDRK